MAKPPGFAALRKQLTDSLKQELERRLANRPEYAQTTQDGMRTVQRKGASPQTDPAVADLDLAALRTRTARREANQPARVADEYTRAVKGRGFAPRIADPGTGLRKQAAVGRAAAAAAERAPGYEQAVFEAYGNRMPRMVEQAGAQNYDQLREAAYGQLAKEVTAQFDAMPIAARYHSGAGEYARPSDMMKDVFGQGRLNVFEGGDPHEFLNKTDPATGLTQNEMFRAVHDYYGHAARGATFQPGGEELAYASHSRMLSPLARLALASETRGQNSMVNYSPLNADLLLRKYQLERALQADIPGAQRAAQEQKAYFDQFTLPRLKAEGRPADAIEQERQRFHRMVDERMNEDTFGVSDLGTAKEELAAIPGQFRYAPQRATLLPPEFLPTEFDPKMPGYLSQLLGPKAPTSGVRGVHFGAKPDLTATDPSFFGTGHRGEEFGKVGPRSYFYVGDEGTIAPEMSLWRGRGIGGGNKSKWGYRTQLDDLYDFNVDPEQLAALNKAWALKGKAGRSTFDDLLQTYGYRGMVSGDPARTRAAAVYGPQPVERFTDELPDYPEGQRFARGGLVEKAC